MAGYFLIETTLRDEGKCNQLKKQLSIRGFLNLFRFVDFLCVLQYGFPPAGFQRSFILNIYLIYMYIFLKENVP